MKLSQAAKKEFGAYMSELRAKTKLTQREVSEQSGVSPSYIALMEGGKRNSPSYRYLEQLAPVYQVSIEELAQRAGYKAWNQSARIPRERIEWAFDCACSDPDFVHGMHVIPDLENLPAKAFVVELFQRATGRNLLLPEETHRMLQYLNGTEKPGNPDGNDDEAVEDGEIEGATAVSDASNIENAGNEKLPYRNIRPDGPPKKTRVKVDVRPKEPARRIRMGGSETTS